MVSNGGVRGSILSFNMPRGQKPKFGVQHLRAEDIILHTD